MNFMYLYLPVALTSINILIPVGLGLVVGLLSGLFGVGGGFLMTPLLIMFGIPATVAAATDSNQIVAASTSGTYAHWKVGNVDFKMGLYLLAGGFIGGLIGVQAIKTLHAMGNADFVIKTRLEEGDVHKKIIEVAEEERCDVIIMGAKKRNWIRKIFGDNVVEKVISRAPCPVLVV